MCCAVVLSTCRVPNLSHAARSLVDRCPGRRLRGSHLLGCDDGRRRKLHACVHVDMQFIRSIGFHHQKKDYPEENLMPWSEVLEATVPQLSRGLMRVTGETHLFDTRTELTKPAHNRRPERRSVQSPKKCVAPRYSVILPLLYLHVHRKQVLDTLSRCCVYSMSLVRHRAGLRRSQKMLSLLSPCESAEISLGHNT